MFGFFKAIVQNRKLLWSLTKNDFKQKYVGNFLGALWAFIQPTATVLIFWFVFQVGFKSKPIEDYPFILWLVSGMFPWFYFAEALSNGTNSILANNYLVKKVVFRVNLLPIIPLLSALIVHLFFIFFMYGMFLFYGYTPSLYWLQIFYYTFALSVLLLGLSWITSSVIVFFKDMGQIVGMLIQFGFWLTPIFWSLNIIPPKYHWFIEINPIVYIIEGYRDSMLYHKWFWETGSIGLYYWFVTITVFIGGSILFRKLRPHFADVL